MTKKKHFLDIIAETRFMDDFQAFAKIVGVFLGHQRRIEVDGDG